MKQRAFSVLGNIAIVNFSEDTTKSVKKKFAQKILKEQKNITTVLEKSGKFSGRLRKMKTSYLAGKKTKEVLYKENDCVFRFNVDTTYFSPRLSNERKEVSKLIKKNENVFVMFAGVAPFSIVIARNSKAKKVFSNELNREANKYAELNIGLNKLKDRVELVSGDVKKIGCRMSDVGCRKFDVIVMPRPNLDDTFLEQAFSLSKKKTRIYYYGFCKVGNAPPGVPQNLWGKNLIVEQIKEEAKKFKKKIKILKVKKAGEIAPYKMRVRIDFQVL